MKAYDAYSEFLKLKPGNAFDESVVMKWIERAENIVRMHILKTVPVDLSQFPDTELSAPEPYASLYVLYAQAQAAFALGEYTDYNNIITAYTSVYEDFAGYYIRNNRPSESGVKVW